MTFTVFMQGCKHYWQDGLYIVTHQTAEIFIIPQVQRPFRNLPIKTCGNSTYLKMWACDRFSELMEQRHLNFEELGRFHDFENILDFIDKHDFFGTVDLWPIFKKSTNNLRSALCRKKGANLLGETGIFLEKLDDAIC